MQKGLEYYLNKSPVVMFEWLNEENWPVKYVSSNCKRLFGYTEKEFLDSTIFYSNLVHKDDIQRVANEVSSNCKKDSFHHKPYRIITKEGEIKYIDDVTYPNKDENGNVISLIGIITECTDIILAQDKIKKHQIMTSTVPYPISIVNKNYIYEMVNDAYCKYFKEDVEDIIGKKLSYFLGEEVFNNEVKPNLDKAFNGENVIYEIEIEFEGIGKRYMKMTYTPCIEDDGTIDFIVSYGSDITKEKEYEKKLLYNVNYSQSIFDAMPNIVIASDGEEIDKANQHMLDFVGYSDLESFKKDHECICDYFEKKDNYLQEKMGDLTWLEYILKYKGKTHKVCMKKDNKEYTFLVTARPLEFDDKNKSIAAFTDITYLTEVEETLKQSEANVIQIIEGSPLAIFVIDKFHKVIHWNKACEKLTGVKKEELIGTDKHWSAFYNENRPTMTDIMVDGNQQEMIDKYYKGKYKISSISDNIFEAEDFFEKLGENGKYLSFSASPITDKDGAVIASIEILKDISEEKETQNKLKKQEELMVAQSRHAAMGEMISMIAHQWRQPLSAISMNANNILADIDLDILEIDSLKSSSWDILRQTEELSKTIDDFKNFFKPNNKKEELRIGDVFQDTLGVIGKSLENNDVKLIINGDTNIKIKTFSRELMQVLINIIKNAKEALVYKKIENKTIIIDIKNLDENIEITLTDNGGGIPENIISNIFEPYFSTKDRKNGTGLGLYISKTIVESHLNGKLDVINTKEGASFKIVLPC